MADEDIAALVVDNGSGMCKVSPEGQYYRLDLSVAGPAHGVVAVETGSPQNFVCRSGSLTPNRPTSSH